MGQERKLKPAGVVAPGYFDFLRAAEKVGLPASAFEIELVPAQSNLKPAKYPSANDEGMDQVQVTRKRISKTRIYSNDHGEWLYWALQDLRNGVFS